MPLAQGTTSYARPDVERNICLESFLELYEYVVICLNAMSKPDDYQEVQEERYNWQWDRESLTRAQGMVTSLPKFVNIVAFVILKNSLDYMEGLAAKLQTRDVEAHEAYEMVDGVISSI